VVRDNGSNAAGRRQRAWIAPRGNLASSVLEVMDVLPRAATLGFAAGLAHEAALQRSASSNRSGRRILAISPEMAERRAGRGRELWLAAGGEASTGLASWRHRHQHRRAPRARRRRHVAGRAGRPSRREELFAALSDAWVEFRGIWDNGRGFAEIRKLWLERAFGLGERIAIQTGAARPSKGTFDTIDETGCLIIRTTEASARPSPPARSISAPRRQWGEPDGAAG
jgi:BirA family biotin operon repressor/biotin-[acetyl-CoA-carboxylase] ligase